MRKGAFHLCSRRPRVYEDRPLFISLLNRSQSRSRGSGDAIPGFGAMRRVEEATVRACMGGATAAMLWWLGFFFSRKYFVG
ncbi:hypothetical protein ES288_A11G371600v1 [Gossypium darwinii]|uniref:Uncharacterized protein n=1 Tax=Gossypium darwinii TaxID=34276 RepID=A0A5D2EV33_GOSDA|nr:hypothetical protein ES288_A11G371600v1 [Gossypium darwinii]